MGSYCFWGVGESGGGGELVVVGVVRYDDAGSCFYTIFIPGFHPRVE